MYKKEKNNASYYGKILSTARWISVSDILVWKEMCLRIDEIWSFSALCQDQPTEGRASKELITETYDKIGILVMVTSKFHLLWCFILFSEPNLFISYEHMFPDMNI